MCHRTLTIEELATLHEGEPQLAWHWVERAPPPANDNTRPSPNPTNPGDPA